MCCVLREFKRKYQNVHKEFVYSKILVFLNLQNFEIVSYLGLNSKHGFHFQTRQLFLYLLQQACQPGSMMNPSRIWKIIWKRWIKTGQEIHSSAGMYFFTKDFKQKVYDIHPLNQILIFFCPFLYMAFGVWIFRTFFFSFINSKCLILFIQLYNMIIDLGYVMEEYEYLFQMF